MRVEVEPFHALISRICVIKTLTVRGEVLLTEYG